MSAATLLFFVMGPLGNVPLFLSALRGADPVRYRAIILRDMLFALGIMVVFLFVGRILLEILGVSSEALTAAGGVILMIIAIRLIFPTGDNGRPQVFEEPFIVPLAIPYTAGPSVLATILLLMSQEPERWPTWLAAILLAWSAAAVILLASTSLQKLLGERGLTAIERLMGMILIIVAMEMLLNGVRNFFLQ